MPNTKDPELTALLDRLKKTCDERKKLFPEQADEVTRNAVQEVHTNLQTQTKKPRQLPLGLLPTDLCRTTWCRPMRPKDMGSSDEPKKQVFETPWGRLTVFGPDCSMREEELLIIVLKRWIENNCKPLSRSIALWLDDLGYKREKPGGHSAHNCRRLKSRFKRLLRTSFELEQPQGGGKTLETASHVLSYQIDENGGIARVAPDPWFVGTIGIGFITGINLEERKKLKGDISKALHRFLSSHGLEGHHNIFLLAGAIGMDMTQPEKEIRRKIKLAISELKRIGFLLKKTRTTNDTLHWYRSRQVLSGKKLIQELQQRSELPADNRDSLRDA
jgi:hypothetical protein